MNLQQRWEQCWANLGVECASAQQLDALVKAYGSPDRHYHTMSHVLDCLEKLDLPGVWTENKVCVRAAIWFHDAVYDSHANDNEQRSADLVYESANEAGVAEEVCRRIAELVMATDHRTEVRGHDAQLICDIDLSIFGESQERFAQYDQQIAQEYTWVPTDIYREKRAAVIESFLRRPRIYRTEFFYAQFEASARGNLQRLLLELSA